MKTIMFVECGRSGYGGSFHSLYHTAVNLDPGKYRPVIVFFNKTVFYEKLKDRGIRCYYLNDPIYENRSTYKKFFLLKLNGFVLRYLSRLSVLVQYLIHLKTVHNLKTIIKKEGIDLIHLNNQLSLNFMGLFPAKSAGIPCIVHLRTFNSDGLNTYKVAFANKVVSRYIAISGKIKEHWVSKGIGEEKVVVIYNIFQGISKAEIERKPPKRLLDAECFKVIYVGRLTDCKGIPFLIEGFLKLLQAGINAKLFLVGDGEDEMKTKDLVLRLGLEERVVFLGYKEFPQLYMQEADVLVLPSKEEGFGRVLLEAMDAGTPVIGTSIGGIPEIIRHGRNGLLVSYGDVSALKEAMLRIYSDTSLRMRLVEGGFETVRKRFGKERYFKELESIYNLC
jgi:glycosyltransferase involved in cell wall biosynthesis